MSHSFPTDRLTNTQRSPSLSPIRVTYTSVDSPPPASFTEHHERLKPFELGQYPTSSAKIKIIGGHIRPSLSDSLLIRNLGPNYPEIASQAAREPIATAPEAFWADRKLEQASSRGQMVHDYANQMSRSSGEAQVLAVAAFQASQKLNAALSSNVLPSSRIPHYQPLHRTDLHTDRYMDANNVQTNGSFANGLNAFTGSSMQHAQTLLNVKPPPRISLPSIRTTSPGPEMDHYHRRGQSINTDPILAKYTITPDDGNSNQQLPKLNNTSPTLSMIGTSQPSRQTLPSLETALSAITDPSESAFSGRSPPLTRPSPAQLSHFGPSPSTYSNPSPASAISPPRFSTAPSYWRTTSRDTVTSAASDYASATTSNGVSTPASSVPGHSPAYSGHTPSTTIPEHDTRYSDELNSMNGLTPRQSDDSQFASAMTAGAFRCIFPGCNAPPFQTQYLLNSHANVHSNTRPHFCPVEGCPRGPGGQGFKRKNEMIRHGLVHQSPGYVCPFCPDQQHKYPRPDNLQRHVRVHHVDRDRDDPMLRDVLAQRPEGGNRGRRRRLGS